MEPFSLDEDQARQLEQFEQFQQFQRFQQFQEFQRSQAQQGTDLVPGQQYQPVPAPTQTLVPQPQPQRRRVPGWLQWIGKKVLGWLILLILMAGALTWAYNHFFQSEDPQTPEEQAQMGGGRLEDNTILPTSSPYETVRRLYSDIALDVPKDACTRFDADNRTRETFARHLGYGTCIEAAEALTGQVETGKTNAYAESIYPQPYDRMAEQITIDSCDFAIEGGPALGTFTVSRVANNQWLITGHKDGPEKCPAAPGSPDPSPGN